MCGVCGCGHKESRIESKPTHQHEHSHADHHHTHDEGDDSGTSRLVQVEQDIQSKNNAFAQQNRQWFRDRGLFVLNLVSSPGSGKTSLLTRSLTDLKSDFSLGVIEGDQETSNDADRIRQTGVSAIQINTGKGCHLDAHQVGHAVENLAPDNDALVFIENVGNLVCPASFDLGEAHKVAILSVTEGDDKPLKYPNMFYAADLMVINKMDLLPYVEFDVDKCIAAARQIKPEIKVICVSAITGEGMDNWYRWIKIAREQKFIGLAEQTRRIEEGSPDKTI